MPIARPKVTEPLAFDGLGRLLAAAAVVRDNLNEGLRLGGIFLTAYHPNRRGAVQQGIAELIRSTYGGRVPLLPHIRQSRAVPMSQASGRSVVAEEPDSTAAHDYAALTTAILEAL